MLNSLTLLIAWQNSRTHNDALLQFLSFKAWGVRRVCVTGVLLGSTIIIAGEFTITEPDMFITIP